MAVCKHTDPFASLPDHRRIPFRLSEKEAEVMDVISEYCREVNKQFQQGRRYCPTLLLTSSLPR